MRAAVPTQVRRASILCFSHEAVWRWLKADLGAPQITLVPLNDTGTGALGALVCLAGLFASGRRGRAVQVEVSLARTATFLQSGELTEVTGRSAVAEGRVNFAGPTTGQHFYRCADGWVAIAATTDEQIAKLTALTGRTPRGSSARCASCPSQRLCRG